MHYVHTHVQYRSKFNFGFFFLFQISSCFEDCLRRTRAMRELNLQYYTLYSIGEKFEYKLISLQCRTISLPEGVLKNESCLETCVEMNSTVAKLI